MVQQLPLFLLWSVSKINYTSLFLLSAKADIKQMVTFHLKNIFNYKKEILSIFSNIIKITISSSIWSILQIFKYWKLISFEQQQHKKKTEKQRQSERSNRKIVQQNLTNHHIHIDTWGCWWMRPGNVLSAPKANCILNCIRRFQG